MMCLVVLERLDKVLDEGVAKSFRVLRSECGAVKTSRRILALKYVVLMLTITWQARESESSRGGQSSRFLHCLASIAGTIRTLREMPRLNDSTLYPDCQSTLTYLSTTSWMFVAELATAGCDLESEVS